MQRRILLNKAAFPQGLAWIFGLSRSQQRELLKNSKIVDIAPGHQVAALGETLTHLIGVVSGRVSVSEKDAPISEAHEGAMLGWLSVVDRKPMEATLTAITPCRLLLIPVDLAMTLLLECKELTTRILHEMTLSIRRFAAEKKVLKVPSAHQRVYVHLLNIVQSSDGQSDVNKMPRQDEIAKLVNTSRETVSRALQILVKRGVIAKRGHQIEIKNINELQKVAALE